MALAHQAHGILERQICSRHWCVQATGARGQRLAVRPQNRGAGPILAVQGEKVEPQPQPPTSAPPKTQQQRPEQQQQPASSQPASKGFLQQVQQQWDRLDWRQRGYAVVLGIVVLAVVPQVLALLVLLLERVIIAGLLEFEEAVVALLFKGGVLLGVVVLIGLAAAGLYLFASKATK